MNHTKEPWHADLRLGCFAIYPNGQDRNCLEGARDDAIVYQNGRGDDSSPGWYRYLTAEQEANAKRIVACVNACAGMGDPVEEITELKRQLRWRPASDLPEKAGMYLVEAKSYTGSESTIIATAYFDGERFPWYDVVRWLPIPPQGE